MNGMTTTKPVQGRPKSKSLLILALIGLLWVGCSSSRKGDERDTKIPRSANIEIVNALERDFGEAMSREARRRAERTTLKTAIQSSEIAGQDLRHGSVLYRLYERNDFQSVWFGSETSRFRATDAALVLKGRLVDAVRSHGFWPNQVHYELLRKVNSESTVCCDAWTDLALEDQEREALLDHLAMKGLDLTAAEDLDRLARIAAQSDGPTPRISKLVRGRSKRIADDIAKIARQDVVLSDALTEYLNEMRFSNPAWHQPRAWRATLRIGERGPIRSTTIAGKEKEQTAAEQMRKAIESARTQSMLYEKLAGVFAKPLTVGEAMSEVVPPYRQYARLTRAFRQYRPIVERGGWPTLPDSAQGLEYGDRSEEVRTLKERLRIEGYWSSPKPEEPETSSGEKAPDGGEKPAASATGTAASTSDDSARKPQTNPDGALALPKVSEVNRYELSKFFGKDLKKAVEAYQQTHQLWGHGSVTSQTLASLNVPARERWNQMRVTLNRWRDSRIGADTHYVHINISDFHAEVWRDGERKMRFRVITGKSTRKKDEETSEIHWPHATPTFSDEIQYIVLNPYWNVPPDIRKKELKPKLAENPNYYKEEGFEVVVDENGYEFVRQKPGPKNALGKVKFLFPNEYSVYMHDTPTKHLFSKPTRGYSHGCIRIKDPMNFAHYLLDLDGRWTGETRKKRLEQWFDKEGETWLTLRQTLPVHIEYYVVRVDDEGRVNFLSDLYDRDEPRLAAVEKRLESYHDNYDLPQPKLEELMSAALSGKLDPDRDL